MTDPKRTLAGVELFGTLEPREYGPLDAACVWRTYGAGQHIVGRREQSTNVFFVIDGTVRVSAYSAEGKEVSYRDLGPGEYFGELSAIDGEPRSADVVALEASLIASMSAETFWTLLRRQPEVSAILLKQLSGLVRKLSERVFEFSVFAVPNRVHAELLRLARECGDGGNAAIISPAPTHADIARRVSTHREAVTRELNALDRIGVIQRRSGALIVPDLHRLACLVEGLDEAAQ